MTAVVAASKKDGDKRTAVVVVLSGGIDSACVAAIHSRNYDETYGITFSYGQRADREVTAAKKFAEVLGLKQHKTVDIGFMRELYGDTNVLTSTERGLPGSFDYSIVVPIRNAVFLSIATAWAFSINASRVAYGAHSGDTSYPDCRPSFAKKIEDALNEGEIDGITSGLRRRVEIWSPYNTGMSKEELIIDGMRILGDRIFDAWSCYASGARQCGKCESCVNRRRSFKNAGIADKTAYLA